MKLEKGIHYAAIVTKTKTIYHEGDERSRTHPGHGYPANIETIKYVEYIRFKDTDELSEWITENKNADYQIIQSTPVEVKTKVAVSVINPMYSPLEGASWLDL